MTRLARITRQDVAARAAEQRAVGHTLAEIAAGMGVTRRALAAFAAREGIDLSADVRPGMATVRRHAMSLTDPAERAEFLLEALEWLCPDHDRRSYVPLCGTFTELQARFLTILRGANGRTVTYEHILQTLYLTAEQPVQDKTIVVHASKLRKRIKEARWPLDLQTVWGVGFRLVVTDPRWRWPT